MQSLDFTSNRFTVLRKQVQYTVYAIAIPSTSAVKCSIFITS